MALTMFLIESPHIFSMYIILFPYTTNFLVISGIYRDLHEEIHEFEWGNGQLSQQNVMNLMVKVTAPHWQSSEMERPDVVAVADQGYLRQCRHLRLGLQRRGCQVD